MASPPPISPPPEPEPPLAMAKWLWPGPYGRFDDKLTERVSAAAQESVALVVGSTGIVGDAFVDTLLRGDTPGGPWKVYALSRRVLPPWHAAAARLLHHPVDHDDDDDDGVPIANGVPVRHIQLDLAESSSAAVAEALKPFADITHVFFAAWAGPRPTELETRYATRRMITNLLAAVLPNSPNLVHVCLLTSREHWNDFFNGTSNTIYSEDVVVAEEPDIERDFREVLANRYVENPVVVEPVEQPEVEEEEEEEEEEEHEEVEVQVQEVNEEWPVTWSIHRTTTVFGFSPRSARNVVATLCVYAAICHKEGVGLRWPGSSVAWEGFSDATDADLVVEQALWAAMEPAGKNAIFNCSNGDVYKWKQLWPILARRFDVEQPEYEGEEHRFKLEEAMAGKGAVWSEIVTENELVNTQLNDVASWWFVDAVFDADRSVLDTMNKSKDFGFFGFRNTVNSFDEWIDKLKVHRIVP